MTLPVVVDRGGNGRVVEQVGCSDGYRLIRVYSNMVFAAPYSGRLAAQFAEQMPEIPSDERRDLIFDLKRVQEIDCAGVAYLLTLVDDTIGTERKACGELDRRTILKPRTLVVCCAGQRVMHQVQVHRVEEAFTFYDSTGQALERYQ